jgi:UDP-glucose:(heptosyl)LPS alpha-1,3-glucosyltransferase
MKICLTSVQVSKEGGIPRYVCELAERMVSEHEVHILTSRQVYDIAAAKFHHVPAIFKPISLRIGTNTLGNTLIARKLKREGVVDIVNSQSAEIIGADITTAHSVHKAAIHEITKSRGKTYGFLKYFEPRSKLILAIERKNYYHKASKHVIAISQSVKEDIIRHYGYPKEDITVIHSGVNTKEFCPREKDGEWRRIRDTYGYDEGDIVSVFPGWEFKRKGLMQVIESIPQLGIKVLVIGSADPEKFIKKAKELGVRDNIAFAGHQRNISQYYKASDIMIFPTEYEPFGLVITEAMSCGLPVITSKAAGAAEIIDDGKDGMILENPHNVDEVIEKTKYLIDNNLIKEFGQKARKKATQYTWDTVAKKTLEVYRRVLE